MSIHHIIAIGGSGQMVAHLYANLFLTGFIREPFRLLVVDTDQLSPSLARLADFFEDVRRAAGPQAAPQIPEIEYLRVSSDRAGTVEEALTDNQSIAGTEFEHSIQAFLAEEDRKLSIKDGLFARPALSAILSPSQLWDKLRYIPGGARIGVVSSAIGGTGGGLTLPVIAYLQNQRDRAYQIRAVFLGQFFSPDPGVRTDQLETFKSNDAFFHETRRRLLKPLEHYARIDGPVIERDKAAESAMRHWAWPETTQHPYWLATSALHGVLTETRRDTHKEEPYPVSPLDRNAAFSTMQAALGRVHSFHGHKAIRNIGQDVLVGQVWMQIPAFLASYADMADPDRPRFASAVQGDFDNLWDPPSATDYGMKHVFPAWNRRMPPPSASTRCDWKPRPADVTREALGSADDAARRVACLTLFTLLRTGGEQ
jgi:hypothetical protein